MQSSHSQVSTKLAILGALLFMLGAWMLIHTTGTGGLDEVSPLSGHQRVERATDDIPAPQISFARHSVASHEAPDEPLANEPTQPLTLVHGWLLDTTSGPIPGDRSTRVSFVDPTGRRRSAELQTPGRYELSALGFGTYWVTVNSPGYQILEQQIELHPDKPLLRQDFTLQRAVELCVQITTPQGDDLFEVLQTTGTSGSTVPLVTLATRAQPNEPGAEPRGGLQATLGVVELPSNQACLKGRAPHCVGTLRLDGVLPAWASLMQQNAVLATQQVQLGQDAVTFVLDPADLLATQATLQAQVIDARTGMPIRGARVSLRGDFGASPDVATDQQGIALIAHRAADRLELHVRAKNYASYSSSVDAPFGGPEAMQTLALEQEVQLEGRVLDTEGNYLDASFELGVRDPLESAIRWTRRFRTRGDGSFRLQGLGLGEYLIRTNNHDTRGQGDWKGTPWVSGIVPLDTRAESQTSLEIRLQPAARLVLQMSSGSGETLPFCVQDARGLELVDGFLRGSEPRPLDLPAGDYSVSLRTPQGNVLAQRSISLGTTIVELDFAR